MKARREIAEYMKSGRIERARIRVSLAILREADYVLGEICVCVCVCACVCVCVCVCVCMCVCVVWGSL